MSILSWFKTETFCCVFSLQSGTVVSIMVLAALAITSFANIIYYLVTSSTFDDNIVPFCLSLAYFVILGTGLTFAFIGAYSESTFWMVMGSIFTGIAIIVYIIIAGLSFISPMYSLTCISLRCPEHLWLQKSHWRSSGHDTKSELDNKVNKTSLGDEEYQETFEESTFSIIRSTSRPISRRRLRPKPVTRSSLQENRLHFVGEDKEERQKEVHLCNKCQRKFANEDDEDVEYCPEEREAEDSDSDGGAVYSAIVTILYFVAFVAFQLYCLYGFLCFANELRKELAG